VFKKESEEVVTGEAITGSSGKMMQSLYAYQSQRS
jgi:hypothetical protein